MPELRRYAAAAEQHSGLYMLAAAELYIREERCKELLKKMGSGPWWCSTERPVY